MAKHLESVGVDLGQNVQMHHLDAPFRAWEWRGNNTANAKELASEYHDIVVRSTQGKAFHQVGDQFFLNAPLTYAQASLQHPEFELPTAGTGDFLSLSGVPQYAPLPLAGNVPLLGVRALILYTRAALAIRDLGSLKSIVADIRTCAEMCKTHGLKMVHALLARMIVRDLGPYSAKVAVDADLEAQCQKVIQCGTAALQKLTAEFEIELQKCAKLATPAGEVDAKGRRVSLRRTFAVLQLNDLVHDELNLFVKNCRSLLEPAGVSN